MAFREEIIGSCKLILGDCIEIMPELGKGGVDCLVTDPPYGMDYSPKAAARKGEKIANDKSTEHLQWVCKLEAAHSKYIFCRWDNLKDVLKPRSCITWIKNNWTMGDLEHEHARQTEFILFYDGINHFFPNGRPTDAIDARRTLNEYHPTEKPVPLMKNIISWTHGMVIDPFMGSGTTGVACQKMGRNFTGIEIDQKHFDTACKRIEDALNQPDFFYEPNSSKQQKQDTFL